MAERDYNLVSLVRCLNCLWLEQKVEDHFTKALFCCLYKEGAHDNPENYRPISLLNSYYKIFTRVIQVRLSTVLESFLGDTQYGFRPKRSTAEPLFCVRRLAEFAEQGTDPLYLIFLDWEKAFDKIDHEKMFQALWRLRIPPAILEISKVYMQIRCFRSSNVKTLVNGKNKELVYGKAVL